ncbi:MAG: DUF938 domain-containing protein [Sphingorhabdus sp.]
MSDRSEPFVFDGDGEAKRFAPATQRNRDAIAEVLQDILPTQGVVVEIASGTGEHIVHFASRFPNLDWQPSDYDEASLASIAVWRDESGLPNIRPALRIDAIAENWPIERAHAMICINMTHISPWAATKGLLAGAARVLNVGAPLYLYGPYRESNRPIADSNEAFDRSLKLRNPEWGLRLLDDVVELAAANGLAFENRIAMPANNLSLVFRRCSQ